jgi:hypothetical protein
MKTRFTLLAAGILLVLSDPAAASLKRVIVLERPDVGFPPFTDTWEQQRLRLAQIPEARPEETTAKRLGASNE